MSPIFTPCDCDEGVGHLLQAMGLERFGGGQVVCDTWLSNSAAPGFCSDLATAFSS